MRSAQAVLIGAVAWGAFAFGSVYPWAYWPLALCLTAAGAASLAGAIQSKQSMSDLGPMIGAFGLLAGAVALQLPPLPSVVLRVVSPRVLDAASALELGFGLQSDRHSLSIAPHLTMTALGLLAVFALLVIASAQIFALRGPRGFAKAVAIIGLALALAGIIQQPLYNGRIYGIWTPEMHGLPFGPFVNKNHFAGWMVMGIAVVLGLFGANAAQGLETARATLRDRLLWLTTQEASRLTLIAGAALVMILSLVMTMSRSGMAAMFVALSITGFLAMRRQRRGMLFAIVALSLVACSAAVVAWAGVDAVIGRFADTDWANLNSRSHAWADALNIWRNFPLTGTGLNTYGTATLLYQHQELWHHYAQAHNDYLQLAAEGGVLLIVPAALCVGVFVFTVRRRFRTETSLSSYWLRIGAVTGLIAIALQETVDFSLQMPGNAVLFAILCGMALHTTPARSRRASSLVPLEHRAHHAEPCAPPRVS